MDVALEFSTQGREADLVLSGADLKPELSLNTALLISLFTNARADVDARLPAEDSDRRGWWGDTFAQVPGDQIGSRLWLLRREKLTEQLRSKAEREVERSLLWLVQDGIAAGIEVSSEIQKPDRLALLIIVERPDASRVEFDFALVWEGVESGL